MKWKIHCKVAIMAIAAVTIYFSKDVVVPVFAATLEEVKQEQEEAKAELGTLNSQIAGINSEKNQIEAQIGTLDDDLILVLASIGMLERDVADKEAEIAEATEAYEASLRKEQEQYEAMLIRIRYMYEGGDASYLDIFMNASSFSDVLNKADYIEQLYEYDRTLLEDYKAVKEEVAAGKKLLELEKEELLITMHEYAAEEQMLEELLAEKESEAESYEVMLAQAKQEATAYQLLIRQQTAKINQLEEEARIKAEEERKKAEAEANAGNSSSGGNASGGSTSNGGGSTNGSSVVAGATGSAAGKKIANYATQFVGNPYVYGGTSLTNGADCSGFVYAVYKACGYSVPRSGTAQRSVGVAVSYANAQPGDIICYPGHVAIYLGGGQIVHASTPTTGIKYGSATYKEILTVRRIV